MENISLDPRFQRAKLPELDEEVILNASDSFVTFEVFHQKKKGTHHSHVGIVHAPNAEMAMVFAKEQFARRGATSNLWIVESSNVLAMDYTDSDIFDTTPDKQHREAGIYKTRDKIEKYQAELPNTKQD
ncbi:MAG: hypothetical protein SGJ04_01715 [Bacteroidota bacterium]|nr:hypothetical protein [Bacteroidota bacterium]